MFTEGIFPIGDGLLDINEDRLKELLVADDINEIYELEQTPFARGKFAAVRRAIHKNSGTHFAAKFLKRRRRAQSSDKEIKHEIAVLMLCNGADNIVKLNAVHESRSDTALLLELATGGELQTFLDNEECLSEAHARYCMREVLKALQYLHKRSIAHLDLKPQNILLTGERIEDGLKLCDFGISRVVAEGTNVREIVGTPDYVAPEVLQYEPLSLLTDIWSVGVLAYVLLSGFSPFGGETKQETFLNISQCALTFPDKLFGGVSAAAIDFIRRALRIKPNDRMTAAGCLEHIWLKDECSIDRQILTDINKSTTVDSAAAADDEDDDDDEVEVDEEEDEVEVDEEEDDEVDANEAEIENEMSHDDGDEDELNISIDREQQQNGTNGSKMESSDAEELAEESAANKTAVITNGKTAYNKSNTTNGYSNGYNGRSASNSNYNSMRHNGAHTSYTNGAGATARYTNGVKTAAASATTAATTTTQRTTAVVTVPAVRATTIPLQYNGGYRQQQQQQHQLQKQQQLQVLARRHSSSDSNKENTYLATKKIAPTTANVGTVVKKPLTATATTTIVIAGSEMGDTTTATGVATSNVVATFTLPSGYNHTNHSNNSSSSSNNSMSSMNSNNNASSEKYITTTTHCLFPDAPTTPKVIRKTPNTEASPTSVKALVKKFQLEGGNTSPSAFEKHASAHLKEAQAANQHAATATTTQMNGSSGSSKKSPISNGIAKKFDTTRKYGEHNGTAGVSHSSSSSNGRRASEPATTVTHVTTHIAHNRSGSGGIGLGSTASSYKTTCVLCIGCGSKSATTTTTNGSSTTNGCRHSVDAAGKYNKTITNGISNNNGKIANNNTAASATATVTATAIVNGGSTASTTTTTALLLGSHHQQQQQQQQQQQLHHHLNGVHHHAHPHHHHHHHHMHVAAKGAAANNLSLDQGIIC